MATKIIHAFSKMTDSDAARLAWKKERDALRGRLSVTQRNAEKADAGRRPLDARRFREELDALRLELLQLDEAWQQAEKSIRLSEWARRGELIAAADAACDKEGGLIHHLLGELMRACNRYISAEKNRSALMGRLAATAGKYGLPDKPRERPVSTPWGPALRSSQPAELAKLLFEQAAARFLHLHASGKADLENFTRRRVE